MIFMTHQQTLGLCFSFVVGGPTANGSANPFNVYCSPTECGAFLCTHCYLSHKNKLVSKLPASFVLVFGTPLVDCIKF